jgi:hypothetical protein
MKLLAVFAASAYATADLKATQVNDAAFIKALNSIPGASAPHPHISPRARRQRRSLTPLFSFARHSLTPPRLYPPTLPAGTWSAHANGKFEGMTLADAARLMGTKRSAERRARLPVTTIPVDAAAIPATFNATSAWPQCASVIGHIRDQSDCGCCWVRGARSHSRAGVRAHTRPRPPPP